MVSTVPFARGFGSEAKSVEPRRYVGPIRFGGRVDRPRSTEFPCGPPATAAPTMTDLIKVCPMGFGKKDAGPRGPGVDEGMASDQAPIASGSQPRR